MLLRRLRAKLEDVLGEKLASSVVPLRREAAAPRPSATPSKKQREPAPVVMYFERDRNQRLIDRVRELLSSERIPFQALDVSGDAATIAFVTREAGCEDDDLPIVFVAGAPVGGFNELVDWNVSGRLKTAVFGD
jgi:hypothetical protein